MSMEVQLIRVDEGLLKAIHATPTLIDQIIFEADAKPPSGFEPTKDLWDGSYLHVFSPYFEHVAAEAGDDPEEHYSSKAVHADPLYRAINGDAPLDYDFCYGPATVHTPEKVKALVADWAPTFSKADRAEPDRIDVSLFLFFEEAAKAGKAVICGIA